MNYWDYIKVEELLSLQRGYKESDDDVSNDEALFITVHQIYELWFKLVLRELTSARALFRKNPVPDQALASATRSLRRCVTIFEIATQHWRVVETLTTRDYLGFRDQLIGASGFQSAQLREVEILLGLDDAQRVALMGESSYKDMLEDPTGKASPALARVERRIAEGRSLKDAIDEWLARTPIDGSSDPEHVERYLERFITAHKKKAEETLDAARKTTTREKDLELLSERYEKEIAAAETFLRVGDLPDLDEEARRKRRHIRGALVFIESNRELPRLSWPREIVDTIVSLEQAMVIWRQRHARMVERMIGRRIGTGGSGGVDYLDRTALRYRVFEDIWAVRTILLRHDLVPALEHEEDYQFRIQD